MRELMDPFGHSTPQAALIYRYAAASRQTEFACRLSEMGGVSDVVDWSTPHGYGRLGR